MKVSDLPPEYWYFKATIDQGMNELADALSSIRAYLNAAGQDGEHYQDALDLMIRLERDLPEWGRERELLEEANAMIENQLVLAGQPPLRDDLRSGEQGPEMVLIGKGFVRSSDSVMQIGPLYVAKYETTVAEFALFVARTNYETDARRLRNNGCSFNAGERSNRNWQSPGFSQTDRDPVVCVSIDDARAYADWLSAETGRPYRLASTEEWLLAAAAGTYAATGLVRHPDLLANQWYGEIDRDGGTYSFFACCETGLHNCGTNDYGPTVPVGFFPANATGLHDMFGNAAELVENCRNIYTGLVSSQPRFRCSTMGGSFYGSGSGHSQIDVVPQSMALDSRVRSMRNDLYTNNSNHVGFRVVAEDERRGL